jgi:hypothetical protein
VSGYHRTWDVQDVAALEKAFAWRDSRGGAGFWLAHGSDRYPTLAIRISGDVADVHYFPHDGHPGFRCLGGEGLPDGGMTTLVYDGCAPFSGEDTPNEFIVPFSKAWELAKEFFRTKPMSRRSVLVRIGGPLPDFQHEVGSIFRMSQLRRADLCDRRYAVGARLLFYAQMDASSLGQRDRLERPECALAEDGVDVADHELILTSVAHYV